MAGSSPLTRLDGELFEAARLVGGVMSRSAAQQIAHWARIGCALEASESLSHRDIAAVLAGTQDYDALAAQEQAVVRAEWAQRLLTHVREAIGLCDEAVVYDNSRASTPYRQVAACLSGRLVGTPDWPPWTPPVLATTG